jgi:hypothetical protein
MYTSYCCTGQGKRSDRIFKLVSHSPRLGAWMNSVGVPPVHICSAKTMPAFSKSTYYNTHTYGHRYSTRPWIISGQCAVQYSERQTSDPNLHLSPKLDEFQNKFCNYFARENRRTISFFHVFSFFSFFNSPLHPFPFFSVFWDVTPCSLVDRYQRSGLIRTRESW